MRDTESWNRIARYALGECTAREAVETRAWIEADPERKALAEELIRLADAGPTAIWDARAAWERFGAGAGSGAEPASPRPSFAGLERRSAPRPIFAGLERKPAPVRRWLIAAAVAAALLASSVVVWRTGWEASPVATAPAPLREITTQRGQTAQIYLSDGTHVTLGVASTLRFPSVFTNARDVYLEGEAYFDVAHDAARQFAVHTARAVARDIGTKFGVQAYPGGSGTEVVVAEGVVALKPAADASPARPVTDSLVLTEADLGRLDENGGLSVVRQVDVDAHLAWMRGRLVFAETPVREALPQLARWYDVDVRLGDSALADARLSATLEVESRAEALELVAEALDARIERQGRTVVLHRKIRRP